MIKQKLEKLDIDYFRSFGCMLTPNKENTNLKKKKETKIAYKLSSPTSSNMKIAKSEYF